MPPLGSCAPRPGLGLMWLNVAVGWGDSSLLSRWRDRLSPLNERGRLRAGRSRHGAPWNGVAHISLSERRQWWVRAMVRCRALDFVGQLRDRAGRGHARPTRLCELGCHGNVHHTGAQVPPVTHPVLCSHRVACSVLCPGRSPGATLILHSRPVLGLEGSGLAPVYSL